MPLIFKHVTNSSTVCTCIIAHLLTCTIKEGHARLAHKMSESVIDVQQIDTCIPVN